MPSGPTIPTPQTSRAFWNTRCQRYCPDLRCACCRARPCPLTKRERSHQHAALLADGQEALTTACTLRSVAAGVENKVMRDVRGLAASRDRNPFRRPKFGNETVGLETSTGWSRKSRSRLTFRSSISQYARRGPSHAKTSKEGNVYICPAFKILTTTGKIMNDDMLFYRARTRDCAACAGQAKPAFQAKPFRLPN